jgi:uncharacterized membrane protein YeaQ/YmgE (transglycosylase-associated protein family)
MAMVIGIAVGLIVAGLLICFLSPQAGRASTFFWWMGIILAVVGAVLVIAPVITWFAAQFHSMLAG